MDFVGNFNIVVCKFDPIPLRISLMLFNIFVHKCHQVIVLSAPRLQIIACGARLLFNNECLDQSLRCSASPQKPLFAAMRLHNTSVICSREFASLRLAACLQR